MLKVLVLVLLAPSAAFAAVPALCSGAANQAEGTSCAAHKLVEANRDLNRTYVELKSKLDVVGRRNLELAENAWINFRDLECNLEIGNDPTQVGRNGTMMPMLLGECAVSLTQQRIRDLQSQIKCPGGDLSCNAK
ncbi:MAG: lysozyme inhibitor LprI family protein [Janthinobacterium lividum]